MAAQASSSRGFSLIQDCGYYSTSCGYCKEDGTSTSSGKSAHGMHAHRLTVYDYQELLDQGWRRSGTFLYKPDNQVTCCRQYTIRLDVTDYQPSKAHRKLLRKWEQYLAGHNPHEQPDNQQQQQQDTEMDGSATTQGPPATTSTAAAPDRDTASPKRARKAGSSPAQQQQQQHNSSSTSSQAAQVLEQVRVLLAAAVTELQQACASGCDLSTQLLPTVKVLQVSQQQQQQQQRHGPKHGKKQMWPAGTVCTSPCAHALAAAVRKHSSHQQQQQQHSAGLWAQPEQLANSLAERFNSLAASSNQQQQQPSCSLTAAASKGHINFVQAQQTPQTGAQPEQQQVTSMQQQQQALHARGNEERARQQNGQHSKEQPQQQQPPLQPHKLEVRMVPNQFIQEEFELWQRYQAEQHHEALEDLTRTHYKGFLVDTPLIHVSPPPAAAAGAAAGAAAAGQQQQQQQQQAATAGGMPSCGYGSFHQQYWLDGKLVAVGVVDVLPRCLSSKYFFWDPDYAWLSLGRYGALREISWVADQHAAGAADLRYYYLGYYIHTCPKMAYKAEYSPSELLCPKRQVWVGISSAVLQALDKARYVVLSELPGVQMKPNLSVPRPLPAAPGQIAAAASSAQGAGGGAATALLSAAAAGGGGGLMMMPAAAAAAAPSREQQIQQRQRERQALDAQLLFIMKQPVRWGALRDSGVLDDEGISELEDRLTAWRAAVGETARTLLYATAQDILSF